MAVERTAAIGSRGTDRSRGGRTDDRDRQSRNRPKPWWLDRRPLWATSAEAEVVVVRWLACASAPPQATRSRGGRTEGRNGRPQHKPKSWWLLTTFRPSGSKGFVASAAEVATQPGRPLPGRDLHPLEYSALTRHTWTVTVLSVRNKVPGRAAIFTLSNPEILQKKLNFFTAQRDV